MINLTKIKRFIRSRNDSTDAVIKKMGMATFVRTEAIVGEHVRLVAPHYTIGSVLIDKTGKWLL